MSQIKCYTTVSVMARGKDFITIEKQNKRLCPHCQNKQGQEKNTPGLKSPANVPPPPAANFFGKYEENRQKP